MVTRYLKTVAVGLAAITMLNSCQEQIDEGARFTFVGNTIATYLQGVPECSHFVEILTRGECIGLMKAYGQYTCFAPTNEAVERFLFEQDSIYHASVDKNQETNGEFKIIDTGIYSPYLSDLSQEKCAEIARNHILPQAYMCYEFMGNSIPDANMNDRDLTLDLDTLDGMPLINSTAKVLWETEVENGVVHVLKGVVSPSDLDVSELMNQYSYFSIFFEALKKTGYAEVLDKVEDKTYTEGDKKTEGIYKDSQSEYPKYRRYGFTVFLESNKVLEEVGVNPRDFNTFVEKCKEWYPHGTKAWAFNKEKNDWEAIDIDHNITDYTDPRNPVNQFVGYHILDRKVNYENLVCHDIFIKLNGRIYDSELDFPETADRSEYYVTMNNRILKVTKPLNSKSGSDYDKIFLNYAAQKKGQNIRVFSPGTFKNSGELYATYNPEASNGSLNVIEDVLVYDEKIMKDYVLRCIMRFDVSSICSELTNNRVRWKFSTIPNRAGETYIPHNYCERVKVYTDDTRLFYLAPENSWHNYQGDEMMALGFFDFAYCLPPLPEGTYEIRMGYSASGMRHLVQAYLDNEVTGLPIDLRLIGKSPLIGWKGDNVPIADDGCGGDEDLIAANDKDMKNRGFLKGPTTFYDDEQNWARYDDFCLRAVIATKYLTAGSHWLRFKNVLETDNGDAQFMHDYFEIVPMDYLKDESISVEEKRK